MARYVEYWVRFSHIEKGKTAGRGRFIVWGKSADDAIQRAAEVLEAKGHALTTNITSVKQRK